MPFDPDRHHRRSVRLQAHDYACAGTYFLTICTAGRETLFGEVRAGGMAMNRCGWAVWEEWERSAELRREIELISLVVMPNHLHGVVSIRPLDDDPAANSAIGPRPIPEPRAHGRAPLHRTPRSVGSFVAGFKAATTTRINTLRDKPRTPVWQRGYYDHIVRSDEALARILYYIDTNPLRWHLDAENPGRDGNDRFDDWLTTVNRPQNPPRSL